MRKRSHPFLCIGLALVVLLGMLYFSFNQSDYDKRTLFPYDYTDMATAPMFFEKGSHTFDLTYAYAPDVSLEILRAQTADADNALPAVLYAAPLSETGETTLTLTLDSTVYDLQIRYTGETDIGFTTIESAAPVWRDTRLLLGLITLTAGAMLWLFLRERRRTGLAPNDAGYSETAVHLLLLSVAVYATLPVLRDFLVNGHDMAYHLLRIEAIKDGLLDGQFPVRVGPTFWGGLGYASPVLYPELFLYIPAALRLCGVSLMAAYQAFVFLINLATLLTAYHAVKRLTGKAAVGLIVSLVYGLGVSRMIILLTRAAIGEALALVFLPCVLLGMTETLHRGKVSGWLIAGMTGLIQTHVISVEIAGLFCALYTAGALVLGKTGWRGLGRLAAAAGITVLLNLWFLTPFVRFAQENLRMFHYATRTMRHAVYPAQWFASFVSPFGNAAYLGTTAEMPLSVGLLPGVGILLYLLKGREDDRDLRALGHVSLGFGITALLVSSTLFPWTYVAKLPVLGDLLFAVQFPWRYLGIAGFFLALVFGLAAHTLLRDHQKLLIPLCLLLAVFNITPFIDQYIQSDAQVPVMQEKYDMAALQTYATYDYGYADTDFETISENPMAIAAPEPVAISNFTKSGTHVSFDYASDSQQTVTLPLYLYPGYRATIDGAQVSPVDGNNHLLALALPAGEGTVAVYYAGFWYFNAANFVSLLTLLGLAGFTGWKRRKPAASS